MLEYGQMIMLHWKKGDGLELLLCLLVLAVTGMHRPNHLLEYNQIPCNITSSIWILDTKDVVNIKWPLLDNAFFRWTYFIRWILLDIYQVIRMLIASIPDDSTNVWPDKSITVYGWENVFKLVLVCIIEGTQKWECLVPIDVLCTI